MRSKIRYLTKRLGEEIKGKIMTPGIDWGYKNGQFLKIIYETEDYFILLSEGTTYLSGMSTPYSPAEYMIAHKEEKEISGGVINIFRDNINPGHRWRSVVKMLKDEVDRYQRDGYLGDV